MPGLRRYICAGPVRSETRPFSLSILAFVFFPDPFLFLLFYPGFNVASTNWYSR